MVDPRLFDLLGPKSPKTTSAKEAAAEPASLSDDDLAVEEAIQREIERLMSLEDPANQLLPPAVRRAKIEQEVRAAADFSDYGKLMSKAFHILRNDGLICLDESENAALQENVEQLCERLDAMELNDITGEQLSEILAMPEQCQKFILRVGIEKFRQELHDDSLAIFTFLTTINEDEADYWYRLGLVAKLCDKDELAVEAFATTSALAPEFADAHLYNAECYLKIGRRGEAISELREAKKCPKEHDGEAVQDHILEVEHLLLEKAI